MAKTGRRTVEAGHGNGPQLELKVKMAKCGVAVNGLENERQTNRWTEFVRANSVVLLFFKTCLN